MTAQTLGQALEKVNQRTAIKMKGCLVSYSYKGMSRAVGSVERVKRNWVRIDGWWVPLKDITLARF